MWWHTRALNAGVGQLYQTSRGVDMKVSSVQWGGQVVGLVHFLGLRVVCFYRPQCAYMI